MCCHLLHNGGAQQENLKPAAHYLAELTATRARLLSRLLLCALNFRENFASRGREEEIYCV